MRLQNARSSSSCSGVTMSDASVRWPSVPSANGCHVPPPVRVQASGPKAKLPAS